MKLKKLLFFTLIIALLTSCVTPYKLFKKGEYYRATLESVKKLRSNPDDIKSQEVLVKAYPLALQNSQRLINSLQYRNDANKYYAIVEQYGLMNTMANEIYRCPKANQLIPYPSEFDKELQMTKEAGAEAFYQLGIQALARNDVLQARLALDYFKNTNNFVRGYKDVSSLIAQADAQSILQVVVRKPLTNIKYQLSSDFFFDNLINELRRTNQQNRVNFFTESENRRFNISHQIITLDFVDFTVGNSRETRSITDCKMDSVIVGYTNVRGEKYPVYGTVRAKFTLHTLEILSAGMLNIQIVDNKSNRIVRQQKFTGEYLWKTTWGTYQGDDRALSQQQRRLCTTRIETPPLPQDMFIEFTRPIYAKTVKFLTDYYRNY